MRIMLYFLKTDMSRIKQLFLTYSSFWVFLVFYKIGSGLHYALLAPLGEMVLPLWMVGAMIGIGSIIQMLLDVPAGRLLDRFGYLRLLKLTSFVFLLASVALMLHLTALVFLLSLFLGTFGWLFFGPGVDAYTLSQAPSRRAGTFISFRDIFSSVGVVLPSALLGWILTFNVPSMGIVIFGAMVIAFSALFFCPKEKRLPNATRQLPTHHHYIHRRPLRETLTVLKRLNPASFTLLLLTFSSATFYGIVWFVVPLVIAHQANSGLMSIGLGIFDFSIVVLGFVLGNLADRGNKRSLVFFGLLLFSVTAILIGFNFGWLFILFGFLATTGDEMASISLWSWLHALDHEHAHDGLLAGIINLSNDLGWAVGPMMAGILYGVLGPSWTIASGGFLILFTWIFYQLFMAYYPRPIGGIVPQKPHRARHRA